MIIYTNSGNPLALKLLLLAKFSKSEVHVEKVKPNEATGKNIQLIPTVELNSGLRLFSTNAIALYLFPQDDMVERNEWLEWTTTNLAPLLTIYMSGISHKDQSINVKVAYLFKKLENQLDNKQFLFGNTITSADLSVWALLAPEGTLKDLHNIDNLLKWFNRIKELPEVQDVLKEYPLEEFSYAALLQGNRYGNVLMHMQQHDDHANCNDSNQATVDEVTHEELQAATEHFLHVELKERKEARTVLPKASERNILVTSALPYVNNVPHLGNIIGCVLSADIFSRYCRLAGYNTLYICGTDEYGTATENKALAEKLTPKEICDKYFELHNGIYRWFGIGFDFFGRTTTNEQTEIVQAAFKDVYDNGYILTESVEQLLCQKCDRFLADRFVEGTCPHAGCAYEDARGDQCDKCGKLVNATELINPRCKVCNTAPVIRSSEQLFIDLPKIEPQLRQFLDRVDSGWTNNARVIVRSWLREGLKPRCITRDLKWGVPVPLAGFEKKVFYVWFDAPFGYVSITKRYTKEYQQWWQPPDDVKVEHFEFMAKDNVPFHGIMWPAVLLAINKGHTLVQHIMATEYLNYEDGKFSKSRGIGVFGNDAQETGIPADVWRFYLASARPEGQDSSFSWNDLASRNNSELLNNLGNFVNRALVFCEKNFNCVLPDMTLNDGDLELLAHINRELRGYLHSMERAKMRDAIRHLFAISRHGNGYMQSEQPWVLLKGNDSQKARAGSIIAISCNISALLANLIFPYMPATARNLYAQLNMKQGQFNINSPFITILLPAGHKIGKPAPLFQKLEQSFIDELKQKYGGTQASNSVTGANVQTLNVKELEAAIQKQGDKVRQLKASTKDKSVWQPEVNILMDLKKKLADAQNTASTISGGTSSLDVTALEVAIQKQGDKVRQLKASTKDKSVWQPEVNILMELKKKLADAQNTASTISGGTSSLDVTELEAAIQKQGDKVRQLKTSTKDKSVWQPEVNILMDLKKKLADAQNTASTISGGLLL